MHWDVTIDLDIEVSRRTMDVLRRLRPYDSTTFAKHRVGRFHDGGYVMLDDYEGVEAAYSLGINNDVSWDLDIARLGIPIFQYDHTIAALPEENKFFNWQPVEISGSPHGPGSDSLENLIAKNGHADCRDLILKCDIESAEWLLLERTPNSTIRQFRQIVIEVHDMRLLADPVAGNQLRQAVINLTSYHHVVHVHANNFAPFMTLGGVPVPNVLELTLARKDRGQFVPSASTFPTMLDMPCNAQSADLYLGRFEFS